MLHVSLVVAVCVSRTMAPDDGSGLKSVQSAAHDQPWRDRSEISRYIEIYRQRRGSSDRVVMR